MDKFFRGLARMFTLPRKVRKQINDNPAVQTIAPILIPQAVGALSNLVDVHVNDPAANAALKDALAIAVRQVFGK